MAQDLYVATNGMSVWRSANGGDTITRTPTDMGLYSCTHVWSLGTHPAQPERLFAGTNTGLYEFDRHSGYWRQRPSPMDECMAITALAFDPGNPDILLAGTQPAGVFRSEDGGETWHKSETAMQPYSVVAIRNNQVTRPAEPPPGVVNRAWTRVTQFAVDPKNSQRVWAGVEIDGLWYSEDGGRHWTKNTNGLVTDDIHGVAVIYNGKPIVYAPTNEGLHISDDYGASWKVVDLDSPWRYTRAIAHRADHTGTLFLTNGDGPPGTVGRLYRSRDFGASWEDCHLPGELRSTIYSIATHPADPNLIFVATNLGQIYRSTDGGESWAPIKRQLPEIRTLLWLPN